MLFRAIICIKHVLAPPYVPHCTAHHHMLKDPPAKEKVINYSLYTVTIVVSPLRITEVAL